MARLSTPDASDGPAIRAERGEIESFFTASSLVAPGFFNTASGQRAMGEVIEIRTRIPGPAKEVLARQGAAVRAFDVWDRLGRSRRRRW